MASTQTEDPAKPALGGVLDTPSIPSSGAAEGDNVPEVSVPVPTPQPAPQLESKEEPEPQNEGGLLSTLMDSIRSATGATQETDKEPAPSAPQESVTDTSLVQSSTEPAQPSVPPSAPISALPSMPVSAPPEVPSVPPSVPVSAPPEVPSVPPSMPVSALPAIPSMPPSMPVSAPPAIPSVPPSMPTTAPPAIPSVPPSMPTTAPPSISMITPPTFMRSEQPEPSIDTIYQTPQDTSTFLPITQPPTQETPVTPYGTFPSSTQPTQPPTQPPTVPSYDTSSQPSTFGQLTYQPSIFDASQPRPGDVATPPALEPTQFSFLDETPQPMPFEPEEGDITEIDEEPEYEESEYEESDEEEEPEEEEETDEKEESAKPSPAVNDVLLTAAMDKVARGEIFEGDKPFFQPYDILPWWGWAIVFFLLGIAFITIVYFLFYQPTEPTPAPQPPTPVSPIPAPPQPQPVPPPDSSRKMYCLIGEDQGRKVVIRVSDPSLCRRTVLLTDEEYENSL